MPLNDLISYAIRGTQLFFSILVLGLAAGVLSDLGFNFDRVTYTLVVSLLTLIYFGYILGWLHFKGANTVLTLPILVSETLLTIFWLAAFGTITDVFGALNCNFGYYYYYYDHHNSSSNFCKLGKALIPFTLFNWLLFTASLVLFILYTFVPFYKIHGSKHCYETPAQLKLGAIYPAVTPVAKSANEGSTEAEAEAEAAAEEANVGINTSDEEAIRSGDVEDKYAGSEIEPTTPAAASDPVPNADAPTSVPKDQSLITATRDCSSPNN
ncbi:membrane-associating domain-containing protein [Scheffersomyces amazonensis]|uniref:membrane-associating domain-containing protein n=1 Tax=Scheffersomyces amazonensis TaxID=1078765 RepID=UPI00315CF52B